ncbi:MAG: TonB-dependent receptor, partial [Gemmatimonadetes bacterium]|nr:TonB-dependent receptor [Gemmatimonadota bacterium]
MMRLGSRGYGLSMYLPGGVRALALTAVATWVAAVGAAAQTSSTLTGLVVDSITRAPLVSAHVHFVDEDRHFVTTDGGRFLILDAHGDSVTLSIDLIGYRTAQWRVAVSDEALVFPMVREAVDVGGIEVEAEAAQRRAELSTPVSTTRMSEEEVTRERGQTLGATLRDVEGVAVIQYGPSIAKPVVRGLHSQRIVVSNGGVRQEGQQWGGEHAPEIDVFGVHEIEVVRGPGSVLYGSDALGGVLRVEPAAPPFGSGLGGEYVLNGFSNNRQVAGSAMVEHGQLRLPVLGEVGGRLRASLRKSGDASTPDYNLGNTGFTELNVSTALGWVRPWGGVEMDYSLFTTDIGLFSGAHVGNFDDLIRAMEQGPAETEFTYAIDSPKQDVAHHAVRLTGHGHVQGLGVVRGVYGFQLNKRREFDSHGPLANRERAAFGLDLYTHSLETMLDHDPVGPLRGTVGVSLSRQGNLSRGKGFLIPQYRSYTGAVFASEEAEVGRATVSGGLRYEYRWQRVFEFQDVGIDVPDETRSYDGLSGSLGFSVPFLRDWSLGGSLGRAWRAPNVNERFSQGVHHGTAQYELGDRTLESERTWNTDLTLRRAGERLDVQVSVYRNAIDNYIYLEPRDPVQTIRGAFPAFNFRQVDATIEGGEASITARPASHVQISGGVSTVRGSERGSEEPLYDMPADRLRGSVRALLPSSAWAVEPYIEVGVSAVREQTRVPEGTIYALPTDGYQLVHVEVGATSLNLWGRHVDATLEIQNLFDTSFRDYLSRYKLFVDDPGRD